MARNSRRSNQFPPGYWKSGQAYAFAMITLILGIAVGYLFRGSSTEPVSAASYGAPQYSSANLSPSGSTSLSSATQPMLERLNQNPNDPELLANIGNQYYDGRDYSKAIDYYERALKLTPNNVSVRTDMGTAMWYSGDADGAIREYEKSLTYEANYPQTLFNMGIVKWQGKHDARSAVELWQKLLSLHPDYPERQKVEQLIQQAKLEVH